MCFSAGEPGARETGEATPSSNLESELLATREDLRITLEQMETANEELRASNEEIRSINEELQASSEELETSKEELQSLNEELNTANNQLQAKVEELEVRTNDLNNLLNSTDIATLFLDRNLCIRWFTPTMRTLVELLPADLGRPIPISRSVSRAATWSRKPGRCSSACCPWMPRSWTIWVAGISGAYCLIGPTTIGSMGSRLPLPRSRSGSIRRRPFRHPSSSRRASFRACPWRSWS